jgi:preprotein translocase subunit SecB
MKHAKFTLNQLFYPEISVDANPEYDPNAQESPTEPTIKMMVHKTDANRYQLGMRLNLEGEIASDRYTIEIFGVANFTVDGDLNEDQQARLIAQSGPNIVYGAMRDHLATVTARCPWGEYYLQPKIIEADDFLPDSEPADSDLE